MGDAGSISDLIETLFPKEVQVAVSHEDGDIEMLYDEERKLISHAALKRQAEFAAGRLCASKALDALGIDEYPILMDAKGAPIWPEGVIGTISHAKGCCAAVVALDNPEHSLGLDVEELDRVKDSVWDYTFLPEEIDWLRLQSDESSKYASILFAAKEAFYKAQYPITQSWLGFRDVSITVDQAKNQFTLRLKIDLGPWSQDMLFDGKYVFFENYVATGIYIDSGFDL